MPRQAHLCFEGRERSLIRHRFNKKHSFVRAATVTLGGVLHLHLFVSAAAAAAAHTRSMIACDQHEILVCPSETWNERSATFSRRESVAGPSFALIDGNRGSYMDM